MMKLTPIPKHTDWLHLCLLVVQQAHPEGGQAADEAPGAGVGAAHLQEPLQPHFREDGGHVALPVLQRRQLACGHRAPGQGPRGGRELGAGGGRGMRTHGRSPANAAPLGRAPSATRRRSTTRPQFRLPRPTASCGATPRAAPALHPRPTWQARQFALQEVPERLPRDVVVRPFAVHKVHGDV